MVTSEEQAAITKARLGQHLSAGEVSMLKELVGAINKALPEDDDCEQEDEFSIVHYGNHFTHELTNHRGELKKSERIALLELIEAAAKVLKFY
jgi:hypothetical protein